MLGTYTFLVRVSGKFTVPLLVIILFSIGVEEVMAQLSVSSMFSDYAVIQQNKKIPIWGTGKPGQKVKVDLADRSAATVIDDDGKWKVTLDALSAGGPHSMQVTSGDAHLEFKDIMVGEVWFCSGQSNMQWRLEIVDGGLEEAAGAAEIDNIRLYQVPKTGADSELERVDAKWQLPTTENAKDFSGVAWLFARALGKSPQLDGVTLGLIDSSYGGTRVEAWMNKQYLANNFDGENLQLSILGWKPSSMYNGMVAPVRPYQLRGFIWYQGESNACAPEQYARLFPGMINHWREEWDQSDLPFIFVQLPNFTERIEGLHFTWLREAQRITEQSVENTAMAVTIDTAQDPFDIHPTNKKPVAERLALLARDHVYGEEIVSEGPYYQSHIIDGNVVRVKFDNTGGGLKCKGAPKGFCLAGEDRQFRYANARLDGAGVVLSHPDIDQPKYVRYAWEGNPEVNLTNEEGLPAAPFRTDDFPPAPGEVFRIPAPYCYETNSYYIVLDGYGNISSLRIENDKVISGDSYENPPCHLLTFVGPARFPLVRQTGPSSILADSEIASVHYDFFTGKMFWTVENKMETDAPYILKFSPQAVRMRISTNNQVTLGLENKILRLDGAKFERLESDEPAYQVTIPPGESRKITFLLEEQTENEKQRRETD